LPPFSSVQELLDPPILSFPAVTCDSMYGHPDDANKPAMRRNAPHVLAIRKIRLTRGQSLLCSRRGENDLIGIKRYVASSSGFAVTDLIPCSQIDSRSLHPIRVEIPPSSMWLNPLGRKSYNKSITWRAAA
jgi:hypothetical protein